jgi:hypothetical protein
MVHSPPRLVALYSTRAQSGKSVIANILEANGYERVKFATALKNMLRVMLSNVAETADWIESCMEGPHKETPIRDLGGKTPRELMQSLGTDWGRDMVHPDLWVRMTMSRVNHLLTMGERVVIDDMRFPNEYEAVLDVDGSMVAKVVRLDHPHEHEAPQTAEGLLDDKLWDRHLVARDGDLAMLKWLTYREVLGSSEAIR